ncbi:MAG: efflux RND transporter periplasmic adaptor subunit [Pirellulales bacterium]|nr:efflux RND transporter periplasmic adaptor subunit [Pirellulales bacterium]
MSLQAFMKTRGTAVLAVVVAGTIIGVLAIVGSAVWNEQDTAAPPQEDTVSAAVGIEKDAVPVVLTPARTMTFEGRISVSGSVNAKRYAMVSARIPGTLDKILVDEGDRVEAGKTRLFQTDAVKLTKSVAIAKQNLAVAESSVREKQALLDKDLAASEQARSDLRRYLKLLDRNAISAQRAEQQQSQCKECEADAKHTQALIDLANAQREQARLNLAIAEKDLADSLVIAPIDGLISERFREPGEMAAAGTPVLRIDDLTVLEISVFLPEQYYAHVVPGQTKMRVRAGGQDLGERQVSYKSPTVHQKLRTFEVKGLINSPPEGVVPGCLAEVTIITDSTQGVGIPAGAIQIRDGKPMVFTVVENRAKKCPIKTGREVDGWREVLDGVAPGTPVISMGQFLVEEKTPVSIVRENTR